MTAPPPRGAVLAGGVLLRAIGWLGACTTPSSTTPSDASAPESSSMPERSGPNRVLLTYFSRAGENYHYGGRRDLDVGNADSIDGYDTVLLASPIWNVRAPMVMSTFTDAYDFTGKQVLPVVTYAISGLGSVARGYATACPGARIGVGLAVPVKRSTSNAVKSEPGSKTPDSPPARCTQARTRVPRKDDSDE